MSTSLHTVLEDAIRTLADNAKTANFPTEAMQYAQAALNLAQAESIIINTHRPRP